VKIKIKKKPRIFNVNVGNTKIQLKDTAKIMLNKNEQVTFKYLNSEYDVAKKDWGYYATPSINGRLKKFGFRTYLIKNKRDKLYIFLVHKNKMRAFKKYCKDDNQKIVMELTNGI
jgi:hypothetical protein|tara:strand:+ start:4530 stop:4874 length:345 start_codon:yes stop_codon:yes gene_type:complete